MEQLPLSSGREVAPRFVAPTVDAEFVTALGDREHGSGIQLTIDRLHEERSAQIEIRELLEQSWQRVGHRRVLSNGTAPRPRAALQLARLTEVVEGQDDCPRAQRAGHGAVGAGFTKHDDTSSIVHPTLIGRQP